MTSPSTLQTRILKNPVPPAPGSSDQQVQRYLTDFFLCNDSSLSQSQAEALAGRLRVNGQSLYVLSKETLVKTFNHYGEIIYQNLQNGPYGYVC